MKFNRIIYFQKINLQLIISMTRMAVCLSRDMFELLTLRHEMQNLAKSLRITQCREFK